MPDDVAFCPGCGLRMWVPGREPGKPPAPSAGKIMPTDATETAPATTSLVPPRDRLTAASAYITFIPATVFVLVGSFKRNRFVRFHSFQSIFLTLATIAAAIVMRILYAVLVLVPGVGYLCAWLACAVVLLGWGILWLVVIVKALQGETFRLPWIGSLAEAASS
jgi:uncharacterized membrane protein